jgi:hypothetical protein
MSARYFTLPLSAKGHHRGGALNIMDAKGRLIADVENIDYQDEIGALFAASPLLLAALEEAISQYGKPGGPWNVPSDPGGWLDRARQAVAIARAGAA